VLRLPFAPKICRRRRGPRALADTAMALACAAAWNGYRPMTPIDQTMHFLRPVEFRRDRRRARGADRLKPERHTNPAFHQRWRRLSLLMSE